MSHELATKCFARSRPSRPPRRAAHGPRVPGRDRAAGLLPGRPASAAARGAQELGGPSPAAPGRAGGGEVSQAAQETGRLEERSQRGCR